jgi:hypothetical protein
VARACEVGGSAIDVVLPASIGSGARGEWNLTILHRNLIQTWQQPRSAGPGLVWLLVQLDATDAAGIVTTSRGPTACRRPQTSGVSASEPVAAQSSAVNSGSSRSQPAARAPHGRTTT